MNAPLLMDTSHKSYWIFKLNRPEKRNALNASLLQALTTSLQEAKKANIRTLILQGEGSLFCAGMDLKEASDPILAEKISKGLSLALKELASAPFVTIAAVHGAALAGGAGLASACDFVLAEREAVFGYPEVKRGLVAAQVMPFLLRKLKESAIKKLLLIGDAILADEALEMGLVSQVVEKGELLTASLDLHERILFAGPEACRLTKSLLEEMSLFSIEKLIEKGLSLHGNLRISDEAQEGMSAFLEKRLPSWVS